MRFLSESSGEAGKWLAKESEVRGMTPKQIQDWLGLPYTPDYVRYVDVPLAIKVRKGICAAVEAWKVKGGGSQVELLEDIGKEFYGVIEKLGEVF